MVQRDDGGYYGRARQPRSYVQDDRRRSQKARRIGDGETRGARQQVRQQGRHDYAARGEQTRTGGRSRFLAVVVLLATALVIVVTGLAVGGGDGSSGSESIPFELLPFPDSAVTTTTQ
jgi:hypothetical protein